MNIALWVVQAVMALVFVLSGGMKLAMPIDDLAAQMGFVNEVPAWLVRFIGIAEVAGAVGLILPAALRIKPWLTPLAGAGLGVVMAMAAGLHLARAEHMEVGMTGFFFALLMFITWGRFKREPIAERGELPARAPEERYRTDTAHAH